MEWKFRYRIWKMPECNGSRRVASGGQCPPDLFLAPTRYFFGRMKLLFLAGKNVEICDFRQKKAFGFRRRPFFFLEITCFWPEKKRKNFGQKNPSKIGENLCPPDFNFAPPPPDLAKLATPLNGRFQE